MDMKQEEYDEIPFFVQVKMESTSSQEIDPWSTENRRERCAILKDWKKRGVMQQKSIYGNFIHFEYNESEMPWIQCLSCSRFIKNVRGNTKTIHTKKKCMESDYVAVPENRKRNKSPKTVNESAVSDIMNKFVSQQTDTLQMRVMELEEKLMEKDEENEKLKLMLREAGQKLCALGQSFLEKSEDI
ncbi:BED-type domain-containing protein [Caenorhabditis elegans]|uniref:BED-type domain-containing protein n=1 Tax=Caenorhabditis elegans TaxID=6239 RepID=C5VUK1_CAEEL|nr:BED-type domain-containing protein [Caenorhabditis elegans]CAZ65547.1 BED-type domain-containing protein [Caenorhabditis elegans]|eukprot:NP_001255861.1 Uncharacterized protein CELE_Y73F8A.13 [Caenorhabditis elegans]